jgi:hypothetical protein
MTLVMTINVKTRDALVVDGKAKKAVMIPFTAKAVGPLFFGEAPEPGCDTQYVYPDGSMRLSARYILVGKDASGNACRVFIENNGSALDNCTPVILTDSPDLAYLEAAPLHSTVECVPDGVVVRIFTE